MYSTTYTLVDSSAPVPVRLSLVKLSGSQTKGKDSTVGGSLLEGMREVWLLWVKSGCFIYIYKCNTTAIAPILPLPSLPLCVTASPFVLRTGHQSSDKTDPSRTYMKLSKKKI